MKKKLSLIEHDRELLIEYYKSKNWDMLDYRIGEIISSKNHDRMSAMLNVIARKKDDAMFRNMYMDIQKRIKF